MHDERSGLFREYLRLVGGLMPHFVVIENVTGITSVEGGRAASEIITRLNELGYYVEARVLKAEEYGVPQERRRIFFIGTRDLQTIRWPEPSHTATQGLVTAAKGTKQLVTVSDALSDLPRLGIGDGAEEMDYTSSPQSEYQLTLRADSERTYNHV